jgi:hypothetical protein
VNEPTMIGLSEEAHRQLQRLKEDGHFREMLDAYRFGIGLALAEGIIPSEISSKTVFSVASVDPNQRMKSAIQTIMGDKVKDVPVYRMAERLADWGVRELFKHSQNGDIDVVAIFDSFERSAETAV